MPTQAFGHSQYWAGSTEVGPGPSTVVGGGYPRYQIVILPSLGGGLAIGARHAGAFLTRVGRAVGWLLKIAWIVAGLDEERRYLVGYVAGRLVGPAYPSCRLGVRLTAHTPESRDWHDVHRKAEKHPRWAENVYRALHANVLSEQFIREGHASTISNLDRHLLCELAYHALKSRGH